jgi:hypothetical protein
VTSEAYTRLRARLAVFLGDQGFDALWRRAIHLVDDRKMRAPCRARGQGLFGILGHLRERDAVVERECDVLGQHWLVDHQQHAR